VVLAPSNLGGSGGFLNFDFLIMNTLQNADNGGHCLFFWQDPAMGKMDVEIRGFMPNAWVISAFLRCASSCKLLVWLVSPDGLARKV
jgi:hypothetical protein